MRRLFGSFPWIRSVYLGWNTRFIADMFGVQTCHAQLLVDAAAQGSGHKKTFIRDEEARDSFAQVGKPEKGWLAFQPYYDDILAKTNGSFLK